MSVCRAHHLALKTSRTYWHAAKSYIRWLGAKSVADLQADPTGNFRKYLSAMANQSPERTNGDEGVSASSQNLAFHAVRFLLEKVVGVALGDLSGIPRATAHARIVDVPPDDIAKRLVESVPGVNGVALRLIYGTAGRLNDILRIRLKDLDFRKRLIAIQQSKGGTARLVPMPASLIPALSNLVLERQKVHAADLAAGFGWVHLPGRLAIKYPGEEKSEGWQYLFAANKVSRDPVTGNMGRTHIQDITLQRAFAQARRRLRVKRHYTIHGLRHAAAQWMERNEVTRSTIQEILGHKDPKTTDLYLRSGRRSVAGVPTPI